MVGGSVVYCANPWLLAAAKCARCIVCSTRGLSSCTATRTLRRSSRPSALTSSHVTTTATARSLRKNLRARYAAQACATLRPRGSHLSCWRTLVDLAGHFALHLTTMTVHRSSTMLHRRGTSSMPRTRLGRSGTRSTSRNASARLAPVPTSAARERPRGAGGARLTLSGCVQATK